MRKRRGYLDGEHDTTWYGQASERASNLCRVHRAPPLATGASDFDPNPPNYRHLLSPETRLALEKWEARNKADSGHTDELDAQTTEDTLRARAGKGLWAK